MEMWGPVREYLDNAAINLSATQVLRKFTASRPSPKENVTHYSAKQIAFCNKMIDTTADITDHTMKTHIFTTLCNSYAK